MLRIVLLASAPALFWLWLFYRRDRWEPEPKLKVLKIFALGALVGYALGRAKFAPRGGLLLVAGALAAVVLVHGAYDVLLSYGAESGATALVARGALVVIVPGMLLLLFLASNRACKASPFRLHLDGAATAAGEEPGGGQDGERDDQHHERDSPEADVHDLAR